MDCDVCGQKIRGAPKFVRIDGASMRVCMKCAKLGNEIQKPKERTEGRKIGPQRPGAAPRHHPRDVFDFMEGEGEIVDDFAARIRDARMQKGWEQKELALKIKEREILVKKIEKGDLIPEDDVRKKIEAVLGIKLTDDTVDAMRESRGGRLTTTLGDVIKIKRGGK
ncbi:MAG: XRE family transcriptional regulator [Methanoculleus sp. SDB]|nr:MAG: XRE family transcriptional regulator [Methanoculleus sp. SDB]